MTSAEGAEREGGSMAEQRIFFVAGATGRVGQQIVSKLLRQGRHVRALVRDRDKGRALLGENLELVEGDTRRIDTVQDALVGVNVVVCATGARASEGSNSPEQVDYEGVRNLVQAARLAEVERFILISSLAVTNSDHPLNQFGRVLDWKLKGEDFLRHSGVPYTIIRPGGLTDEPGGQSALQFDQGDRITGQVSRADVAEVALRSLDYPSSVNATFEVIASAGTPPSDWSPLFETLQSDEATRAAGTS